MRRGTKFLTERSKKSIKRAREQGYNVFILPSKRKGESDTRYIHRAWTMNKKYFETQREFMNDKRTEGTPLGYRFFKEETGAFRDALDISPIDAIKKTIRSHYVSAGEMARINVIEALRSDKDKWKELRNATRSKKGRFTSIGIDDIGYDRDTGAYVLKNLTKVVDDVEFKVEVSINYDGSFEIVTSTEGVGF